MISLVVSTLGRVDELDRFFTSLDSQTSSDFEVVLVDQNDDDRLVAVLQRHPGLRVRHLRSGRGVSRARNVGLAHAWGEILAIPDDDCWYPLDLLATVSKWFQLHAEYAGLSAIKRDADNNPVGPKWPGTQREINKSNVFDCAISSTIFLRRVVTSRVGTFDERIGVGAATRYQSGEETEYLLRALEYGFRLWYDPAITVHHPPLGSMDRLRRVTYPFALGTGYVLRAHGYSWLEFSGFLARSLGGAALSLSRGNFAMSHIYLLRAAGQLRGYLFGPSDLRRASRPAN